VERPFWDVEHWRVNGDRLVGYYRTPYGSFEGVITQWRSPRPQLEIVGPPQELRDSAHWPCFQPVGNNHYAIHFSPPPPNPDAGIVAVEAVLAEALAGQRRRHA